MNVSELQTKEYHAFYQTYIDTLVHVELMPTLKKQAANFPKFIRSIPEGKWHYAYDTGKWTIAEVLLHIIDAERVFQYRALRFLRGDSTPLPGFDQNLYVPHSNADKREKEDSIAEYVAVRQSTIALLQPCSGKELRKVGVASGSTMSVAALGFIICGHQRHHRNIIRERYL